MSRVSKIEEVKAKLASIAEKQKKERLEKGKAYLKTHNGNILLAAAKLPDTDKQQKNIKLQALKERIKELNWHPRREPEGSVNDPMPPNQSSAAVSKQLVKNVEPRLQEYSIPSRIDKLLTMPVPAPGPPFPALSKEFTFVGGGGDARGTATRGSTQQTLVRAYDPQSQPASTGSLKQVRTLELHRSSRKENKLVNHRHERESRVADRGGGRGKTDGKHDSKGTVISGNKAVASAHK
ncbi:hypothetical protein EON65_57575, partial [archaeon]